MCVCVCICLPVGIFGMIQITEIHHPYLSHAHLKHDQAVETAIDICTNKLGLS